MSVTDNTYVQYPATASTSYGTATDVNEYHSVGSSLMTYNTDGSLTSDSVTKYTFDTEQHMVGATNSKLTATYYYDPFGRQVQKTVNGTTTEYIYSGWQRLADYNGSQLANRYVYGTGLDEVLVAVAATNNTPTYMHQDRLGSVIATTNASGVVTGKYTYGLFGETSTVPVGGFGFTGQRYDSELTLYNYKNRYYSPAQGRFLRNDPAGYAGGSNLYAYAGNDPVNHTDPLGLVQEESGNEPLVGGGGGTTLTPETPTYDTGSSGFFQLQASANAGDLSGTGSDPSNLSGTASATGSPTGPQFGGSSSGSSDTGSSGPLSGSAFSGPAGNDPFNGQFGPLGPGLGNVLSDPISYTMSLIPGEAEGALVGKVMSAGGGGRIVTELTQLGKAIASNTQYRAIMRGEGVIVAPAKEGPRLAATYGGKAEDWVKVVSNMSHLSLDGTRVEVHAFQRLTDDFITEVKNIYPYKLP